MPRFIAGPRGERFVYLGPRAAPAAGSQRDGCDSIWNQFRSRQFRDAHHRFLHEAIKESAAARIGDADNVI